MSQVSYQVMMVAGEASGDQRAADCITSWSKDFDIHFFWYGGALYECRWLSLNRAD